MTTEEAKKLIIDQWRKDSYSDHDIEDMFKSSDIIIRDTKVFVIGNDWHDEYDIINTPSLSHVNTTKF